MERLEGLRLHLDPRLRCSQVNRRPHEHHIDYLQLTKSSIAS